MSSIKKIWCLSVCLFFDHAKNTRNLAENVHKARRYTQEFGERIGLFEVQQLYVAL